MEIRRITPAEKVHYQALSALCFLDERRWDVREALRNPPTEEKPDHGGHMDSPVWAVFDNGKMLSAAIVNDYTFRMNGNEVKMGGIGGVATRPEARGQGLIRRLMRPIFEEMREAGQLYSFLYPFSYEYYRKFGYELCFNRRQATIPIEQFTKFPYPKKIVAHEPEDDWKPYARIYDGFTRGYNLAFVRKEQSWKEMLRRDPYLDLKFTYLNYGTNGEPNAYLLYDRKKSADTNYIQIRELCWTCPDGLHAVFGFFGRMGAEYEGVKWNVPDGLNIQGILANGYDVEWAIHTSGMNRIVDVPTVLNIHPAPTGSGKITIGVTDAFLPENTGLYRIEWENGNLTAIQKAETFESADVETNVTTLAQLTTGYLDAAEARYRTDTVIRSGMEELQKLFPKKNLYLLEGF